MNQVRELYLESIYMLAKALGNKTPKDYISSINKLHDKNEAKALKVIQSILRKARKRFLLKFKVDKLKFAKADTQDEIKTELRTIMASAFEGASAELVHALEKHINDLAHNFSSVYDVDINYNLVNDKAVQYLTESVDNYFTTLADSQAQGIKQSIADAMADKEGYTIRDIVSNIRDSFGKDTMYFDDREIDSTDWALLVARTETARAASFAQQAIMEDLGLQTWQWQAQGGSCCDECAANDDEIVEIGSAFPSGDDQPPVHPNCLPPGELIKTKRGLIPVEKIRVGDEVWTHKERWCPVIALSISSFDGELVKIETSSSTLLLTPNHPVYHNDGWTNAESLNPGDEIVSMSNESMDCSSGQFMHKESILAVSAIKYKGPVYNFQVEEDESYVANDIIVHNCRCIVIALTEEITASQDSNADESDVEKQ